MSSPSGYAVTKHVSLYQDETTDVVYVTSPSSEVRVEPAPSGVLAGALTAAVEGAAVVDDDETSARILDVAYELFCHMGIQRTTMEDVARRAGISRITVYRRFATKAALVDRLVRREIRRYFDQFLIDIAHAETAAERVVLGFVSSLRALRTNPLIGGLMVADPNALVPSTIGDGGRTLATVREFVAGQLRREQDAGNVSRGVNVDVVAELMVRVASSFLVIPSHIIDLDDDDQLSDLARQFLVPMLQPT
jgi:TetR/AcrR family transcriptional regulator, repressor for uid operon